MRKRLLLSVLLGVLGVFGAVAQTVLISPTVNNGGFESATATPWNIVNGTGTSAQPNYWVIDTGATAGFNGTKCAFITNSSSAPYAHSYDNGQYSTVHLYQDVTFPAAEPVISFSFRARQEGESGWDRLLVYISSGAPTGTPTAGTPTSNSQTLAGYTFLYAMQPNTAWTTYNVAISAAQAGNATAASNRRILFVWQSDDLFGSDPPIAIDNVTLTSACQGVVAAAATTVTSSTATFNWTAFTGATGYNVRYKKVSDPVTVATWATPTAVAGGATTSLAVTGLSSNTQYEYQVSAVGASCTAYSPSVTFTTQCAPYPLSYTQDFESITTANTLPPCMAATTLNTNVFTYTSPTGSFNQTNHTPGGSKFASFQWGSANKWIYTPSFNLTGGQTYQFSFWYITDGYSGWTTLRAGMGTSQTPAGMTTLSPAVSNATNQTYQQYVTTFTPATNGVYFFGINCSGTSNPYYLSVDDINLSVLVPCTGTPSAATISGPSPLCANTAFTLTATGYPQSTGGLSFQWQSSSSATGPFTNITGATGTTYNGTGITATTYYRLQITCTASGQTSTSNVLTIALNSFLNCYCTSAPSSTADDDIGQVTLGTFANPTTAPTPLTGNPTSVNTYTNFSNLGPIQLVQGTATAFSATQINNTSNYYTCYLKVYIDYNHNGSFTDPGEQVFGANGPAGPASPTFTGSITAPTTSLLGITRMRVVLDESGSAGTTSPCGTYSWGETEDYTVNIIGTPPAPVVTNSGPVCSGQPVTVTATTTAPNPTFTLTGTGIGTPLTNSTGVFTFTNPTASATGTYNVTVTSFGFTSPTGSTTVTFNPLPVITLGTVTSPTTCGGNNGSIQINGAANTTYTLAYRRNSAPQATTSITTNGSGSYTITGLNVANYDSIRVTNPTTGCVSNNLAASLVAPSAPAAPSATFTQPLCLNSTLELKINTINPPANATYDWFGPNGFIANPTNPGPGGASDASTVYRPNIQYSDTGSYSVAVTINGCKSSYYQFLVSITPPSQAPAVTPVVYCKDAPAVPLSNAVVGQNLRWYGQNATGGTPSTTAPTPSTATVGNSTYYVTQTQANNGCESPRTGIVVTVRQTPVAPAATVTSFTYCQFDVATPLVATPGVPGDTVVYYTVATGGTPSLSLTPSTNVPGTYTYYAAQRRNGCEGPRREFTVVVKAKPAPPVVVSPLNVCQFDVAAPLTAQGQDLRWYVGPTGGAGVPSAPTPYTGQEDSVKYYVTQTIDGCESDRAVIQVNVNYKPNATFVASKPFVCQYDTISFTYYGNARPDAQYNWFVSAPYGTPVQGAGTQGPFVVRFDSAGTYNVRLTVNNRGCISQQVFLPVEVRPLPNLKLRSKSDVCVGEVVDFILDSATDGIASFNWTFDGADTVYGTVSGGPYGLRWNTPGEKYVTVTGTTRACTSRPLIDTVTVHPNPAADIINVSAPAIESCAGDSIQLQARDLGPGYFYNWTPTQAFQNRETGGGTIAWATPPMKMQKFAVYLTVSDSFGCQGSDSLVVTTKPCCDVYFPNAFSPNGDNKNDRFMLVSAGNPVISSFRVMNRWGRVIWETADPRQGWDGTFAGQEQPSGTYFWFAKYKCTNGQEYEQKGEVTLLR